MKKLFALILMTTVLISCGGGEPAPDNNGQPASNNGQNTPDDKWPLGPPPEPVDGIPGIPTPPKPPVSYAFDREVFNRERQLWLDQGIQNYSFWQDYEYYFTHYPSFTATTVIVKNGDVRYFRRNLWDEEYRAYREGRLYPPDGNGKTLIPSWELRISISELYEQLDQLANSGAINTRYLDIMYDGELHFPVYVDYSGIGGFRLRISKNKFVIDPEIPEETQFAFDRDAFSANRDTWAQQGRRDYTFRWVYSVSMVDYCKGIVVVNDGELCEFIPSSDPYAAHPTAMAQAWIGTIDDVFAKIEAEADAYDGGGLLIAVDYHNAGYPQEIDWVRIFPDSPAENSSCRVGIYITEME